MHKGKYTEIGMVNLTFPDTVKILANPGVWISDTPDTLHMTQHAVCMVPNESDNLKGQSIVVNGKWEFTSMQLIKGQMINKKGMEASSATLTDYLLTFYSFQILLPVQAYEKCMGNVWQ